MKKRVALSKFIIYIVLFLGIVLSVLAYFYTQNQHQAMWENSQKVKLNLKVSKFETDFYFDLLKIKADFMNSQSPKDLDSLPENKHFERWNILRLDKKPEPNQIINLDFKTSKDKSIELHITSNQINQIIENSAKYGYSFFTLDGSGLYIAFTKQSQNNDELQVFISKAKPVLNTLEEYDGYLIHVLNEKGKTIYNKHKQTHVDAYAVRVEGSRANMSYSIVSFVNKEGIGGIGSYGLLFMSFILIITFLIVTYLFKQNTSLNSLNAKMLNQGDSLKTAYNLFRKITGNSFDIISVIDSNLKLEYANSAYAKILNYNPRNLQGLAFVDLLPEINKEKFLKKVKSFDFNKGALNFDFEMLHANKKDRIIVESMIHAIYDEKGEIENYIAHCKDITAKRESLKALLQSKRRFKDFADSSADWLWETDDRLRFSFVSSGIKNSTGFLVEDLLGRGINSLFYKSTLVIDKLTNDRGAIKDIEIKVKSRDSREIWLRISAIPVYNEKGVFTGYRGVGRNITYMKVEQEKMLELATTDYLTGLLNRSAFLHELDSTLNLAKRNGIQGALLFIDLDMFKVVNESHGYDAGDKVLLEVSSLLQANLRTTDIIGRIGGDEFAVIMHDINPQEVRKKIKQLINRLSRLKITYNGEQIQTTSSIGVVKYPNEDQDPSQILTAAGLAMHKAKDMGRNRVYMTDDHFFEDSFTVSAKQKMKWLNILRSALDNDNFEMHFQPMIPAEKDGTVIFESLLRIRDENNNLGSPVFFIEAAENFGLSQSLDISVLKKCIKHHKDLMNQGKDCMLSINISGLSLGDDVVLQALKDIVRKEKPVTDKIIIEVTETAAMRDEEQAKIFVSELHSLGFKFALDDFGSGYSSFYYLKNLDVDYIKIDGEFVKNLETSTEDRHFVKALSDLAKGLDIKIIAEFVENQSHVNILKEIGIDYMQGYHISKPIDDLNKAVKRFDHKSIDEI
ncbi:MAG TPA: hypothetical protein DCL21_05290 [Alphaproteobacteria bacterium]|nr:hypothetical protein [Alphaproteobacteria bacterium]